MPRSESANLTEIFKAYRRRDWLDLYLADDTPLHLSRGKVTRDEIQYDNYISSVEELNASIETSIDRITINCQNVNSLLGFNLASNLRLLDYALGVYGKIYQSERNPALTEDIETFRCVLANAEVDEQRVRFELVVDYDSLGAILASRSFSPLSAWRTLNGIEVTVTPVVANPKTRADFKANGREYEFGGWEFFEEPTSDLPGAGGNEGLGIGGNCFTGDTLISTPDGEIPIRELRARLREGKRSVYSFNPETGEIEPDEIEEVFENTVRSFYTFTFEHAEVNVTPRHRFFVDGEFKHADDMMRGRDSVKTFDGRESKLLKTKHNSDKEETVWNFRVKKNRTYFANGCAVHNVKSIYEIYQYRPDNNTSDIDGEERLIQIKRDSTAPPTTLKHGELQYQQPGKLFIGKEDETVERINGETNTASNVGSGFDPAFFKGKTGVDLEFRRAKAVAPIVATQNENDVSFSLGNIDPQVRAATAAGLPTGSAAEINSSDSFLQIAAKTRFQFATIGSEWLNIKRMSSWTGGADITNAVNDAITQILLSNPKSGQLLIPRGEWYGNGGHSIPDSTKIHADGFSLSSDGVFRGTMYRLNSGSPNNYIFKIENNVHNAVISEIGLDCSAKQSSGIGLWIYGSGLLSNYHLKTELFSVYFLGGRYGIKNESASGTHFQNDGFSAYNCGFKDVRSAFYCNSINGSFYFYKPAIFLPTAEPIWGFSTGGTAFDIEVVGTLIVSGHHIVGQGSYDSFGDPTDNSVILRTIGQHNRIVFTHGQDEKVKWFYYNGTTNHYPQNPIIIKDNGGIQSQFYSTANMSFALSGNYITNRVGYATFLDSATGAIQVLKEGKNFVETRAASTIVSIVGTSEAGNSTLTAFGNLKSRVVDQRGAIRSPNPSQPLYDSGAIWNKPYRMLAADTPLGNNAIKEINCTEGMVKVSAGVSAIHIFNNTMFYNSADDCSVVDVWIEGASSGVFVETVVPNVSGVAPYFSVNFNAPTDDIRKVYFKVR